MNFEHHLIHNIGIGIGLIYKFDSEDMGSIILSDTALDSFLPIRTIFMLMTFRKADHINENITIDLRPLSSFLPCLLRPPAFHLLK